MKKLFPLLLVFLISLNFLPTKTDAVAVPILRVVAGSTGEKVLIATAEKAGIKFATKTARQKAIDKWNMELYERYAKESAENKLAYENMINRMNNPVIQTVPDKPNYGQIAFDTASFLLGVDILFDVVEYIEYASFNQTKEDFLVETERLLDTGEVVIGVPGITINSVPYDDDNFSFGAYYTDPDGVATSTGTKVRIGTSEPVYYFRQGSGSEYEKVWYWVLGAYEWVNGVGSIIYAQPDYTLTLRMQPTPVMIVESPVLPVHVPQIVVPTPLQPYKDNVSDPLVDPVPTSLPNTVPMVIPVSEPYPDPELMTEPINEPIGQEPPSGEEPPTEEPPGGNPPDIFPIALLLALLDLLIAIINYLLRMMEFVLTIPLIPSKPINNIAFIWFREVKIVGIHIYTVVSGLATIGLSFLVFKAIRKVLP